MKLARNLTVFLMCTALTGCSAAPMQKTVPEHETIAVLTDPTPEPQTEPETFPPFAEPEISFDYTICFTGDISASNGARTTSRWISHDRNTSSCFDETILEHMHKADICFANHEFPYLYCGGMGTRTDYHYEETDKPIEKVIYADASADFWLRDDGSLCWDDLKEHSAQGMSFLR